MAPSSRVDIVPQGEFHFEVRLFEDSKDKRYRSWSLPFSKRPGWGGDSRESWLPLSSTM